MAFLRDESVYCITTDEISKDKRDIFSYVCIGTATLSALGACVQMRGWYKMMKMAESRRIPSPTPHVVFSLALADFFVCIGVILMSILFITLQPPKSPILDGGKNRTKPAETWYWYVGVPIESFTMFSYVSSYMWTMMYAVDICLQVHQYHTRVHGCMYHIISWLGPMWIVGCGQYGFLANTQPYCSIGTKLRLHYMVCYVPLLVVMVMLPVIYWLTTRKIHRNVAGSGYFTDRERMFLRAVHNKFFCIIGVFIFCWILNVGDGFHDMTDHMENTDDVHFGLWMCEAVINPLQGFLNCLVYGQHKQFTGCCQPDDDDSELFVTDVTATSGLDLGPEDAAGVCRHPLPEWFETDSKQQSELLSSSGSISTSTPFSVRLLGEHKRL